MRLTGEVMSISSLELRGRSLARSTWGPLITNRSPLVTDRSTLRPPRRSCLTPSARIPKT